MSKWVFLNNTMVPEENAVLHIRDLTIQRGYGVFDFLKVVNGSPVFMDDHLERFYFSASQLRLSPGYDPAQMKQIIFSLLKKNELEHTGVRMTLTGGYSPDAYQLAKPNLVIETRPYTGPAPGQLQTGIHLISYAHQRQLPQVKSIDYLMAIWLQEHLKQHDADDVLYHQHGWVTECPRSNFFIVHHDDSIVTPLKNILKGVMRKKLVEWAGRHFHIEERDLSIEEIRTAREAFITSTTKTILPVASLDDYIFPARNYTMALRDQFIQISGA